MYAWLQGSRSVHATMQEVTAAASTLGHGSEWLDLDIAALMLPRGARAAATLAAKVPQPQQNLLP